MIYGANNNFIKKDKNVGNNSFYKYRYNNKIKDVSKKIITISKKQIITSKLKLIKKKIIY